MKELNFYFDYLSPFSYFAWLKLPELQRKTGVTIHLKPVALGPLLNHWEIKGPGEVTPKREFLLKQCLRYSEKKGISFTTPKTHPFNSLYALRLSLSSVSGDLQNRVVDVLWKAGWQDRLDLGNPDELVDVLNRHDLPGGELYEKSFSREGKVELKKNIEEALGLGVFGVPSFVVSTEVFWGQDSMEDLELFLQGKDTLDVTKLHDLLHRTPRAASQSVPL